LDYIKIATGLFVILNPFVLIPVFLSLAGDMTKGEKMRTAITTAISVFIIMTGAIFGGKYILTFFGITVNDFRIAGGVLIFLMALSMARAKEAEERYTDKEHAMALQQKEKRSIAVVPLAIPLMAGPAGISLAIIDGALCSTITSKLILISIMVAISLILWLSIILANEIAKLLGHNGLKVLSRVMGVILLAVSVDFLVEGIRQAFYISS
jgi:MarC family membrane protein